MHQASHAVFFPSTKLNAVALKCLEKTHPLRKPKTRTMTPDYESFLGPRESVQHEYYVTNFPIIVNWHNLDLNLAQGLS